MTTNIYILADLSIRSNFCINKIQGTITKMERALTFTKGRTNLHLIGYCDNAFTIAPYQRLRVDGNPNLGAGLTYLKSIIRYVQKYGGKKTRSIFILLTSGSALYGWQKPLKELFHIKEFAFGLRYVVTFGKPEYHSKKAFSTFTDSPDNILYHFSESRLCSLVENIQQQMQVPIKIRLKH